MLTGQILLQLIIILIVVQLSGYLSQRVGLHWVIGEILAGIILGPSVLGLFLPTLTASVFAPSTLPTLQTLGDIGLILYMFSLGTRLDTHLMLRQSWVAVSTSVSGTVIPLLSGSLLAFFLFPAFAGPKADLHSFVLLVGVSTAITAFPVLARLLNEKRLLGTNIGTLALTSAAIGDVLAWCLLALVIAIAHAQGLFSVALTIGLVLLFLLGMFLLVRPLLFFASQRIHSEQILIALCIIMLLLSAFSTNAIGIHPVFGAFLMGIILPRKPLFVELVRAIEQMNTVLFLPLFFVYSGLHTQLGLISSPGLWLTCLLVLLTACVGKIMGCMWAARWKGESWHDALTLGVLMNTRGLVELVVLNIGRDLGILSPTLFAMLVIMALATTMMTSPLLTLLGYRQSGSEPTPPFSHKMQQKGVVNAALHHEAPSEGQPLEVLREKEVEIKEMTANNLLPPPIAG